MNKYSPEHEKQMISYYRSLSEKDRRRYAAIEAMKYGYGGQTYISNLFGCSRTTIAEGIREFREDSYYKDISGAIIKKEEFFTSSDDTKKEKKESWQYNDTKFMVVHNFKIERCLSNKHHFMTKFKYSLEQEYMVSIKNKQHKYEHIIEKIIEMLRAQKPPVPIHRIRREGGGNTIKIETTPILHTVFLEVLREHTAGSPVTENIKWTNLTLDEIAEKMAYKGVEVSRYIVKQLLEYHGFKKRKGRKCRSYKYVEYRDDQFKYINVLKESYAENGDVVICIDTKKKEYIGNYYRDGELYCIEPQYNWDHDFISYSEGVIIPYGIYDLFNNHCSMFLGTSKDNSEFVCDNIRMWWYEYGQFQYPEAKRILILADSGGSNSYRHNIFKQDFQQLANDIRMELRIAHYPPYSSKHNPIEHRVFCHVTRACQGVVFTSIDIVKELIEKAKTKTGLKVVAKVVNKEYKTKRKATEEFMSNMPIQFDAYLGRWNYLAIPQ